MSKPTREQLLDHLPRVDEAGFALPSSLQASLARDSSLESWWARSSQQVRALRRLRRHRAPLDLAGRVVAAIQGGYRQERATEYLATLNHRVAPPELLGAVRSELGGSPQGVEHGHSAPAELDERVASELKDMERSPAGRNTGSQRPGAWLTAALLVVGVMSLSALLQVGEVLAGDTEVARGSASSFADITAFECIQVAPGSPQAAHLLRGLDAFAGGTHEGSRR